MWKTRQTQKLDRILAEIAALNEGSLRNRLSEKLFGNPY